jgi:hypothetical protein
MADANGAALAVGDRVEIVQMDDSAYLFLISAQGVVDHIPEEAADTQVTVLLDPNDLLARALRVPGLSTQQAWVKKIVEPPTDSTDEPASAPVEG